jgi:hypothetical protein
MKPVFGNLKSKFPKNLKFKNQRFNAKGRPFDDKTFALANSCWTIPLKKFSFLRRNSQYKSCRTMLKHRFSLKYFISKIGYKLMYSLFSPFVEVGSLGSVEQTSRVTACAFILNVLPQLFHI